MTEDLTAKLRAYFAGDEDRKLFRYLGGEHIDFAPAKDGGVQVTITQHVFDRVFTHTAHQPKGRYPFGYFDIHTIGPDGKQIGEIRHAKSSVEVPEILRSCMVRQMPRPNEVNLRLIQSWWRALAGTGTEGRNLRDDWAERGIVSVGIHQGKDRSLNLRIEQRVTIGEDVLLDNGTVRRAPRTRVTHVLTPDGRDDPRTMLKTYWNGNFGLSLQNLPELRTNQVLGELGKQMQQAAKPHGYFTTPIDRMMRGLAPRGAKVRRGDSKRDTGIRDKIPEPTA